MLLRRLLDAVFLAGVGIKALDGLAELIAGIPLLLLSPSTITSVVRDLTADELLEDPHDVVANLLMNGVSRLHGHDALLLGIYLVVHGLVKLAIVAALIVGALRVYPWAIAALGALTIAQVVDLVLHPSLGVVLLTLLDVVIIALTWREWRQRRSLRETWRATISWLRHRATRADDDGRTAP